jgi:hypothetical protein
MTPVLQVHARHLVRVPPLTLLHISRQNLPLARVYAACGLALEHIGLHLSMRAGSGEAILRPFLEFSMTADNVRRFVELSENLTSAAQCARELTAIVLAEAANGSGLRLNPPRSHSQPLMDESTLSVIWSGKTLYLGNTHGYRLLARLAQRVNQYVTHLELLRDIWDDEFADTSLLRSGVQRLRVKLRDGGMGDLACAINGHHGHYMLDLRKARHHTDVTRMSHRTSQL